MLYSKTTRHHITLCNCGTMVPSGSVVLCGTQWYWVVPRFGSTCTLVLLHTGTLVLSRTQILRYPGTAVPCGTVWCSEIMVPYGIVVPGEIVQYPDTLVPQYCGTQVLWYHVVPSETAVPTYCGTLILWYPGTVTPYGTQWYPGVPCYPVVLWYQVVPW